jgi:hypothetical protein
MWPSEEVLILCLHFLLWLFTHHFHFGIDYERKIYYKLYTNWANFFYIPSLSEVLVDELESEEAEVDVDIDM